MVAGRAADGIFALLPIVPARRNPLVVATGRLITPAVPHTQDLGIALIE